MNDWVALVIGIIPSAMTAVVAVYAIRDGRERARELTKDQRRADVIRLGLDYALRRKFALMDRVARGAAEWEGLLQYRERLKVDLTAEGIARLEELTGGYRAWGSYRAAAHELGDSELERAAIGLGNTVPLLLMKRPDLAGVEDDNERHAYALLKIIWERLAVLRMDVEHQLSPR